MSLRAEPAATQRVMVVWTSDGEPIFPTNSRGHGYGDWHQRQNCRPERERALRDACLGGDLAQFEELVKPWNGKAEFAARKYCVALDIAIDKTGRNFLHWACDGGNAEIVRRLRLEHNVPVGTKDVFGQTPFHIACSKGHTECARNAVATTAILSWRDDLGQTPFHAACVCGSVETITFLFQRNVSIETPAELECGNTEVEHRLSMTPLMAAVYNNYPEVVRLLLNWKANHDTILRCTKCTGECEWDEMSLLDVAQLHGDGAIVQLLGGGTKRKRRETPVKDRAAKVDVTLPPTPDGVRDAILSDSPRVKADGKRRLQRHQKACQQKVERVEKLNGDVSVAIRFRESRNQDRMSRYWKKKELEEEGREAP